MARVQYAAPVSAIVGSVGGWTFQTNRSGEIVRLRPKGLLSPSNKQSTQITSHIQLVAAYSGITPAEKLLWEAFAIANTHQTRFGQEKTLTGQNWFISINSNRLLLGAAILTSPPIFELPNGNAAFTIALTAASIIITKQEPLSPAVTALKVWTTPPLSRSTSSMQSSLRFTQLITAQPFGAFNLTSAWVSVHRCQWPPSPLQNRFTLGIMVQLVNTASGVTTAGNTQLSALITPTVGIGIMAIGTTFIVT